MAEEEIRTFLDDPSHLSSWLKDNAQLSLSDSIYSSIVEHFLRLNCVTIESLSVQRNLYGRHRSNPLTSLEADLLLVNLRHCLSATTCSRLTTVFLQYLHNISRCFPSEFADLSYLCAMKCLSTDQRSVVACLLCASLEKDPTKEFRFDLLINHFYSTAIDVEQPWIDQMATLIVERPSTWLRKAFLERRYEEEFLKAIDEHDKEKILTLKPMKFSPIGQEKIPDEQIDFTSMSSVGEVQSRLSRDLLDRHPIETVHLQSLIHLFTSSSSTSSPVDLHALFVCASMSVDESLDDLRLFRLLIDRVNNYYVHQYDLLDDNRYRLVLVAVVCHLIGDFHQRRVKNEHPWYRLYRDVPEDHPLPTFDLLSDLIRLLAVLTSQHRECQDEVLRVSGTIEAILSMSQIDLNQPKAQACVVWLVKCLTADNEPIRDYIKQIK